jgi:predicted DNA-binding WGR domain protein
MSQRSLRFQDSKSDKFWTIALADCSHTVTYGRYGTEGQSQTKDFPTAAAALKSYEKLVAEKLKKGYLEDGTVVATANTNSTTNLQVERKLNLNPEDWFWATWRTVGASLGDSPYR